MSYHLAITRFGLVASDAALRSAPRLSGKKLLEVFRQQAILLNQTLDRNLGDPPLLKTPKDADLEIIGVPYDRDPAGHEALEEQRGDYRSYIAVLPRRETGIRIDGAAWHISYKVSTTSCSLHEEPGHSKLWVSIEGIPLSNGDPGVSAYASFVNHTEKNALSFFGKAFKNVLGATISQRFANEFEFSGKPIKIILADDDTRPVARVLDAMHLDKLSMEQMSQNPELRSGLSSLQNFVAHISPEHAYASSDHVVVESMPPAIKGLIYAFDDSRQYTSFFAGFARHAGDGGGYEEVLEQLDNSEPATFDYMRSRSAAVRLSAMLADREARKIDSRPQELHY